jgi:mRNA export factor
MDVVYPLMVVATAARHILTFDLNKSPTQPERVAYSPLRWQTRVVTCFPTADGYGVGSIEGRVAIEFKEEQPPDK